MTGYCQVDLYFRAQITKKIRMSKFSPRKIVFSVVFFPRFVPEKHRHARFLRFKMAGGAHAGGAFGMGDWPKAKKNYHCFTSAKDRGSFLKKSSTTLWRKSPCFGVQSGCRWHEVRCLAYFVRCREALLTALHGRTMRANTDDARERSKTVAG